MRGSICVIAIATILLTALTMGGGEVMTPPEPTPKLAATPTPMAEAADVPALLRPTQEANAAEVLAKMVWGEARGCTPTEQAACVWCVLNRVDSPNPYYPDSIIGVVTQPYQFHGYAPDNPIDPDILKLVEDVLSRWSIEETCIGDVGRVLPKEYLFFTGDGQHNNFRTEWIGGETWDWSLDSPYGEVAEQ